MSDTAQEPLRERLARDLAAAFCVDPDKYDGDKPQWAGYLWNADALIAAGVAYRSDVREELDALKAENEHLRVAEKMAAAAAKFNYDGWQQEIKRNG